MDITPRQCSEMAANMFKVNIVYLIKIITYNKMTSTFFVLSKALYTIDLSRDSGISTAIVEERKFVYISQVLLTEYLSLRIRSGNMQPTL